MNESLHALSGVAAATSRLLPVPAMDALMECVLEEIDYGVMLVTANARICHANHRALRECGASRPMQVQGGHVAPRKALDREPFFRALAAASRGRRAMFSLEFEGATLSLAVVPLPASPSEAGEPKVLLLLGKTQACEPLSIDFFAMANRLTTAETVVLKGLCLGLRPAAIAQQSGVAISTVRTQISCVRVKTNASSIADLVRMVTILPPVVPALNRMDAAMACA